jgi:hypothetical protein
MSLFQNMDLTKEPASRESGGIFQVFTTPIVISALFWGLL